LQILINWLSSSGWSTHWSDAYLQPSLPSLWTVDGSTADIEDRCPLLDAPWNVSAEAQAIGISMHTIVCGKFHSHTMGFLIQDGLWEVIRWRFPYTRWSVGSPPLGEAKGKGIEAGHRQRPAAKSILWLAFGLGFLGGVSRNRACLPRTSRIWRTYQLLRSWTPWVRLRPLVHCGQPPSPPPRRGDPTLAPRDHAQ